ncbi:MULTISPECIES: metallophosphoesterase [Roseobacteraceae]|uniref:metallophosphoesterase family protein n=1 Tax=Roseobacteraceae TaxID=2854170 RepID=UPI001C461780|nr:MULTISPECIES: metallophosphoesterase family protein [Roseobacteraceae]MBV7408952.1 metallophosphatase family protein [Maritimibacter sp. DP1N21-5]MBY5934361.1 metallophosphatase family protein [Tateyamaria omphalii]
MKFAVLADIHGNSFALDAVLHDMDVLGVTEAVNLGDLFSGPIDAAGTADLLMERSFPSVRGNHDRYLLEQERADMGPTDQVAFDQLSAEALDWLGALPTSRTVFGDVFLCHGTPMSDTTYWLERVEADGTVRAASLEEVAAEAGDVDASLILCGHTHTPRCVRLPDGRAIVNPGSVGCPAYDDDAPVYHVVQTGTPNASYAIVEREGREWAVTFRSVPYDFQRASACAVRYGRANWARALATGWFDK